MHSVARLEDKYDLLKDYPRDSTLFKEMYDGEAIDIDMLVYQALHHRSIPMWVERDWEQERIGKINYLGKALDLFLSKCHREEITSFAAFDELYMIHYCSYEWVSALISLTSRYDTDEAESIITRAKDTVRELE